MLMPRIITAIVLATLVIWGVFALPVETFAIGAFIVLVLGLYEWSELCYQSLLAFALSTAVLFVLCLVVIYISLVNPAYILGAGFLFWLFKLLTLGRAAVTGKPACLLEAILTLLFAWVGLVMLKAYAGHQGTLVMLSMLIVWSADTFAYFGGKRFGKNKLAPSISPGKTREGVFAGAVGAVIVAIIYTSFFIEQVNSVTAYIALALVTIFVALISVVGDLSESKLKRAAGAKDSGKLLPGHGGVLDRIDGLIAGVPVFAFYWWLLVQFGIVG